MKTLRACVVYYLRQFNDKMAKSYMLKYMKSRTLCMCGAANTFDEHAKTKKKNHALYIPI